MLSILDKELQSVKVFDTKHEEYRTDEHLNNLLLKRETLKTYYAELPKKTNYKNVRAEKLHVKEEKSSSTTYRWEDGSQFLPNGWKRRISEGESQMEFIMSPYGVQYKTRYVAV